MSHQPMPTPGREGVTARLMAELDKRRQQGIKTYGTTLRTFNGRDALWDALEESLDLCQYLMQAIMERDSK